RVGRGSFECGVTLDGSIAGSQVEWHILPLLLRERHLDAVQHQEQMTVDPDGLIAVANVSPEMGPDNPCIPVSGLAVHRIGRIELLAIVHANDPEPPRTHSRSRLGTRRHGGGGDACQAAHYEISPSGAYGVSL